MRQGPPLVDPWLWAPVCGIAGALILGAEVHALRTGRSPLTDVYRSLPTSARIALTGWMLVTACHLNRRPRCFGVVDPYSALGRALRPKGS